MSLPARFILRLSPSPLRIVSNRSPPPPPPPPLRLASNRAHALASYFSPSRLEPRALERARSAMEADDQRSRNRDRTPRSRLASSSSSPSSALTREREDRDRGHEAGSSSESQRSQEELSRMSLLLQQSSDSESFTRDQRNLVDLSVAVLRKDIVRAKSK